MGMVVKLVKVVEMDGRDSEWWWRKLVARGDGS